MQFILAHLDNNAVVINTLGMEIRGMLDEMELYIFRIKSHEQYEDVNKKMQKIIGTLSKLRRTEPDFLQFLGGLLVIFMNFRYDETFQFNICYYDIGDNGKLTRGKKKQDRSVPCKDVI